MRSVLWSVGLGLVATVMSIVAYGTGLALLLYVLMPARLWENGWEYHTAQHWWVRPLFLVLALLAPALAIVMLGALAAPREVWSRQIVWRHHEDDEVRHA